MNQKLLQYIVLLVAWSCGASAFGQYTNGQSANAVLGQLTFDSFTPTIDRAFFPTGLAIDTISGKVYVADFSNNRVLRFSSIAALQTNGAAEAVLGQPDFNSSAKATSQNGFYYPHGLAVDGLGNLYVADNGNNRILRFANAATLPNGAPANAVLGQQDFNLSSPGTNDKQFNSPVGLATDSEGNLWVADLQNRRVLRFAQAALIPNGSSATTVLGQPNFTSRTVGPPTSRLMNYVYALVVDSAGNLFVCETTNSRVLRFDNAASLPNGAPATVVLGQPDFTSGDYATTQTGMFWPKGVALDVAGNLYVGDQANFRILRFENAANLTNCAPATAVLGQTDFYSRTLTFPSPSNVSNPTFLAVDKLGNLLAISEAESRIMRYANAAFLPNGSAATSVLGQVNFYCSHYLSDFTMGQRFDNGLGITVDTLTEKVYISDTGNHRVLRFSSAAAVMTGSAAEAVLGQPDFTTNSWGKSPTKLHSPLGLTTDMQGNLYVAEFENNRVLRFANAASLLNGAPATSVLGQPDFYSSQYNISQTGLNGPSDVAIDASGNLYVADGSHRVIRFANAASLPNGAPAASVLGQPDFTSSNYATTQSGMFFPRGVTVDQLGNLFVAEFENNRVLRFDDAALLPNGAKATAVLGQPNFESNMATTTAVGMYQPFGLKIDPRGTLFVADQYNHRVILFENATSLPNGSAATTVIGQESFTSKKSGTAADKFAFPNSIGLDKEGNLFVGDVNNFRILFFKKGLSPVSDSKKSTFTYELLQNYPNPFNPSTLISYQLPAAGEVKLEIFDVLGRKVKTFVNEWKTAGSYSVTFNAQSLVSGVYFYRLQAGSFVETKKMLFVK